MDQREFNRQMSSYLRDRKSSGKSILSRLTGGLPRVEIVSEDDKPVPEEVPREHVEMVMRGERVPQPEPEMEFEEPPRRSFMDWFRGIFVIEREKSFVEEDVDISEITERKPAASSGAVDADVKEMLRTCVGWVNRLPPEDIQEIRRSDEYQEFKRLLDKYGLLKK